MHTNTPLGLRDTTDAMYQIVTLITILSRDPRDQQAHHLPEKPWAITPYRSTADQKRTRMIPMITMELADVLFVYAILLQLQVLMLFPTVKVRKSSVTCHLAPVN